jgi:GLPGLI family protein
MKKTIKYITFLCCFVCVSQNKNLTVDYTLYISENINETNKQKIEFLNENNIKNEKIIFKLSIRDSISFFIENNGIASSSISTKLAINKTKYSTAIYFGDDNTFYFKNNPNFIFFDENEFLIKKKGIDNWNITSESKLIDGRICYKATATDYNYHNKGKKIDYNVTAWFCPELPFRFGPVYYNNLPGLILEISYLDIKLIATSLKYELDEREIVKPTGKKTVTIDEYNIKLTNKMAEMFEELEKQNSKN